MFQEIYSVILRIYKWGYLGGAYKGRGEGRGVRFQEKVMSHYIQYKLLPCREQLTVYRQTDIITNRQSIVEDLRSLKISIMLHTLWYWYECKISVVKNIYFLLFSEKMKILGWVEMKFKDIREATKKVLPLRTNPPSSLMAVGKKVFP